MNNVCLTVYEKQTVTARVNTDKQTNGKLDTYYVTKAGATKRKKQWLNLLIHSSGGSINFLIDNSLFELVVLKQKQEFAPVHKQPHRH